MASLARILSRQIHLSARRHALSKFSMPAMSPTMTEGGITQWKKQEGESFSAGDVILEIETDKATIDVEAQDDGVLAKIISSDGTKNIRVGTTIAILAEEGDDLSAQEELPRGDRIFASPVAKKLALERGIPLGKVKGTGPEGRIILADVENYKLSSDATAVSSSTVVSQPGQPAEFIDIPLSSMRKTIGERLTKSKQDLPHYYVTTDIDMGRTLKLREVFNQSFSKEESKAKLSVNDFIVKATALALRDVPEVNSAWLDDKIRQYHRADISVAVATPTGLITPIIRDAGSKGLSTISTETKALAKKARDGKLQPNEYQGGSFTISNMGMMGVSHFTAIINPPQSAILALGSVVPTLVPVDNEKGFGTKQIMKATLSADHRVVDGAINAKFLQALKGYLENPLSFML
ncbi:uncharacterized protein EI90DRAFT_3279555 [Cantharellus anzutake]|uniref:uncharacterized protein n=1 Tax=Cantharellus anzutake TaxID=1750568 RepID=UPI00190799C2|nr:uncharacterized protein EI90DRAFT_3279555 [Cantharellus anzutake]KAF8337941.1 hypothetical protein EI90DRAFT_3279555 [Cantharellus anzutake]